MKKRILALLMTLAMCLSLLPMTAMTAPAAAGDCTVLQWVCLPQNGKTYLMKLNDRDVGSFTFMKKGSGWNIRNGDSMYLTVKDGKLALSGTAETAWTYRNGAFSTTVKTKETAKASGYRGIPGSFISAACKKMTKTYYLSTVSAGEKLSAFFTCAALYKEVTGSHNYWYVNRGNGTHDMICKKCGEKTNTSCVYDQKGDKCVCGAANPSKVGVKIGVNLMAESNKNRTTYTAKITTKVKGDVKVKLVQYSVTDGRFWIPGSSYSSCSPINSLKVRVLDSNGKWYYYNYPDDIGNGENAITVADILPEDFPTSPGDMAWRTEDGRQCYLVHISFHDIIWFCDLGGFPAVGLLTDAHVEKRSDGNYGMSDGSLICENGKLTAIEFENSVYTPPQNNAQE